MHLIKSGVGMGSRTACGRNIIRTPMSTDWAGFTGAYSNRQCEKCAASPHAEFQAKQQATREHAEAVNLLASWEPVEDADAWKSEDDAIVAAHRAKN